LYYFYYSQNNTKSKRDYLSQRSDQEQNVLSMPKLLPKCCKQALAQTVTQSHPNTSYNWRLGTSFDHTSTSAVYTL